MENYTENLPNGISFEMVYVEGGQFTRGNKKSKYRSMRHEHEVILDSFYIGKFQVTQFFWEEIMGKQRFLPSNHQPDFPAVSVSLEACRDFKEKLKAWTGKDYRFPTDAEWLYAGKGGKYSRGYVYAGSDDLDEVGWYKGNSDMKIHPVGQKKPNELGLYDMSGNVNDWCQDWYHHDYYARCAKDVPIYNPLDVKAKISEFRMASVLTRGGDFLNSEVYSQVDYRWGNSGSIGNNNIGIRLCYRPKEFDGEMESKASRQSSAQPGPSI